MAALSKAWICGRSLAGIAGSNPAAGRGCLFHVIECCHLAVSATGWSLLQRSPTERGVCGCELRGCCELQGRGVCGCELQGCWDKKESLKRGTYDKEKTRNVASSKKLGLSAKAWGLRLLPTVPLYKNYTLMNHVTVENIRKDAEAVHSFDPSVIVYECSRRCIANGKAIGLTSVPRICKWYMEELGDNYYTFRRRMWKITNDSDIKMLPIYLDRWGGGR